MNDLPILVMIEAIDMIDAQLTTLQELESEYPWLGLLSPSREAIITLSRAVSRRQKEA
jgi:hypothetical protein